MFIAQMQGVNTLFLHGNSIGDVGALEIAQMKGLVYLSLQRNSI